MTDEYLKFIENRKRRWLGLEMQKIMRKDYFENTNHIALGTFKPLSEYEENLKENWYQIRIPTEFNWMLWSSAGTYKSKLVQTMLPYFYKKGYYICIIEAKDETLSVSLKQSDEPEDIYPEAYHVDLPILSHLPSYVVSPYLTDMDRIEPELVKKFDKVITLNAQTINSPLEWRSLFHASDVGGEVLHVINQHPHILGDLQKIEKVVRRGYYKNEKGEETRIHPSSISGMIRVLENIRIDNFLNAKGLDFLNLEDCWEKGKIPTISFFQKRPAYMRIYVTKIIEQEYNFARKMKKAHGKDIKILNIYDDCQLFINTQMDENNPANAAVKNTIRMGRSYGFNNIFTVQDILDFNLGIYNGCELFVGYIRDFGNARMLSEHKEQIEANRKMFSESRLPTGYSKKNVAYYHIPRNDALATVFFPQSPLSGGW